MSDFTLRVDGMACEGCAKSVSSAVTRLDPGAKVSVDLGSKAVTVTQTSKDRPSLEAAIKAAGYDILPAA